MYVSATPFFSRCGMHPEYVLDAPRTCLKCVQDVSGTRAIVTVYLQVQGDICNITVNGDHK